MLVGGACFNAETKVLRNSAQSLSIIVTGGAGFLGSRLCQFLVERNHKVLCVDSLLTSHAGNIARLMPYSNFTFVKHDVIERLTFDGPLDRIYNLACAASPRKYQVDPVHTFKTCVLGAINMLELAKEKSARILQASTSEVYGDPSVSPQPEGYYGNVNTFGPRSCYDEGKRAAETLFHDYAKMHGVSIKVARIFNTYGPAMSPDDGRVVSNFIVQAMQDEDITIYGDGTQTRSFCYRDDLVGGLIRLMESPAHLSRPVNLGNPNEVTILELAQQILGKLNTRSKLVFGDLPVDDPRQRRPDISVANRVLKWSPIVSLSDGLDRTIAHFQANVTRETVKFAVTA